MGYTRVMLEDPGIAYEKISARVEASYGLRTTAITFLPIGADPGTAVYRVTAREQDYFLKLRKGFNPIIVSVPLFLFNQGIREIIPPLPTRTGRHWTGFGAYKLILYPFIPGKDAYAVTLQDRHWIQLGRALKAIHAARMPAALARQIPRETFDPRWREMVRAFQDQVERNTYEDPTARQLADYMREQRAVISKLLARADDLAQALRLSSPEFVLTHSDLHPGNLHLTESGDLYLVDWDNPRYAPREHDLMHLNAGAGGRQDSRAEALFYQGYGSVALDRAALAYYRSERVIEDLAVECQMLLLSTAGGPDREQELGFFKSNFMPGHEIDVALGT